MMFNINKAVVATMMILVALTTVDKVPVSAASFRCRVNPAKTKTRQKKNSKKSPPTARDYYYFATIPTNSPTTITAPVVPTPAPIAPVVPPKDAPTHGGTYGYTRRGSHGFTHD